jgi:hypothetical protein
VFPVNRRYFHRKGRKAIHLPHESNLPAGVPADVFKFFCLTFIVPPMIEKISLPMDSCDLRSDAFEVANQV